MEALLVLGGELSNGKVIVWDTRREREERISIKAVWLKGIAASDVCIGTVPAGKIEKR